MVYNGNFNSSKYLIASKTELEKAEIVSQFM